jgi:hypothetical protein
MPNQLVSMRGFLEYAENESANKTSKIKLGKNEI